MKKYDGIKQAQLRIAETERSAIEKKLIEERMALAEQTSLVESLKKSYPALRQMPATDGIPPAVVRAYIEAQVGIREAQRQVDQLTAGTTTAVGAVKQRSTALLETERKIARRLAWDSAAFGFIKSLLTLVVATAVTVLLLCWIFGLLRRYQQVATFNTHGVMWAVAALLTVLFVYQAFQVASIALAGAVLLVMLLWLMAAAARQARAGRNTGAVTKTV